MVRLEELILSEGFSHLVDELATRMQCSKSTLYAVAAGKDRVVHTVFKRFSAKPPHASRSAWLRLPTRQNESRSTWRQLATRCGGCRGGHVDMVADDVTFEIWALNARASARRVREFIGEGVEAGLFRGVPAEFVGESVSLLIDGIQHGELLERTGLSSGEAYTELSELVVAALTNTAR